MKKDYYQTRESAEAYIKIAEGYDGRELINELNQFLEKGSSVLELGTGPGTDLKILSQYYNVIGSDFSQHFLDILVEKNISSELLLLDAITLNTEDMFDCIYSNKVLQHLTDDELMQSIHNQNQRLNPDGIICHSFWAGEDCYEMKGSLHNYHTKEELEQWFSPFYKIFHLDYYKEMENGDSLLLIAKKRG